MLSPYLIAATLLGVASVAAQDGCVDSSALQLDNSTVIQTTSGPVQGVNDPYIDGILTYKGIPFAASTEGEMRWTEPRVPEPWTDVLLAESYGPMCYQNSLPSNYLTSEMSEDCLNLNIWTSATSTDAALPVYFWIYGGGFVSGANSLSLFESGKLSAKGIVVVSINHRIGSLGFLANEELLAESSHNSTGNYGLLDQLFALQWVQNNIAKFGGDPSKVTVGGVSSGCVSVYTLVNSPLSEGLISGGICESGIRYPYDPEIGTVPMGYRTMEHALNTSNAYLDDHNVSTIAEARNLSIDSILVDNNAYENGIHAFFVFRPVLDGYIKTNTYLGSLETGAPNDVPILNGYTAYETGASSTENITLAEYEEASQITFGDMYDEYLTMYAATNDTEADNMSNLFYQDLMRVSQWLFGNGWAKTQSSAFFPYYWTHALPGAPGANHSSEIMYAFNSLYANDYDWSEADREVAEMMSSYWSNFVKTGSPNGDDLVYFPANVEANTTIMHLDNDAGVISLTDNNDVKINFITRWLNAQTPCDDIMCKFSQTKEVLDWMQSGASGVSPSAAGGSVAPLPSMLPGAISSDRGAAVGSMVPMEQVTSMLKKMREDQELFLHQQREAIVQQVLESIQGSTASILAGQVPARTAKAKHLEHARPAPSSPTARLEQNLHALVQHSLAESGLDFPHVHNTAFTSKEQNISKGNTAKTTEEERSATRKQIILSRREEGGGASLMSPAQSTGDRGCQDRREEPRLMPPNRSEDSPLHLKGRKRDPAMGKRRQRRHKSPAPANRYRPGTNDDREEYAQFVDPVDAAFNSVRKKVDQRTLAILDKSKTLLGQMKQSSGGRSAGNSSFVAKLRQRYAVDTEDGATDLLAAEESKSSDVEASSTGADKGGDVSRLQTKGADDEDQASTQEEGEEDSIHSSSAGSLPTESVDTSSVTDLDAIRCDLELLRPPSNPPGNDGEWENELARQILTIYATSVKAKALEKTPSNNDSLEKANAGTWDTTEVSLRSKTKAKAQRLQQPRDSKNLSAMDTQGQPLTASCSLPAISRSPAGKQRSQSQYRPSSSVAAVHFSWEPSQRRMDGKVVINMPKVPRPIWFAGTGAVKAVWCALADGFSQLRPQHAAPSAVTTSTLSMCDHRLCEEVRQLEAKKKFAQCITTLESLLIALVRARGVDELETKLWKQLVVTCNAFASRCIDYQKFSAGLQLIKQAEHLIDNSILVDSSMRMELLAYLYDTYAHYYYRRRKPHAGLQYILKAHEIHSRQSSWAHLAKCRLHIANLLSFQIKHAQAMTYMASILEMIEENKLEDVSEGGVGGGSAQKLCLAAVCYNNLAVEQLHLREFEAASVSSANAQRLAKLCLSYSNRWLAQFQATSDCVALAITTLMEDTNASKGPLAGYRATPMADQ
ncbi:hypothetical protein BBJ28_00012282 [Nothophytophthora sp. Chile5]|nr:hypothetical protein BBJ28_00012282 [Nothophytophthora sp. Chile5]